MTGEVTYAPSFPGFPDFRANVTFTPRQFFPVIIPHCQRGCVRLVGYMLRKVLGWVDAQGNPTREQLRFSYRELITQTGISRGDIRKSLADAIKHGCVRRVEAPRRDAPGRPGRSGLYELHWDHDGEYTDSPGVFCGFYYPEAAFLPDAHGNPGPRRPKAARKNIPNDFFDVLLCRERLAVVRVVGALLFYSIQWGPGGERKVAVSLSITALSRLTNLSRARVHMAVQEAVVRGYIVPVDGGCFDPAAGQNSRAATYAIRWVEPGAVAQSHTVPTAGAEIEDGDQYKKVNGAGPVQKGERDQYKKENGEAYKKVNGISIKTDLKTLKATATAPESASQPPAAAAVEALVKAGFDEATAQRLSRKHSLEVIRRQVDWLPLRSSNRNRLGLLRRAIEGDWPRPESAMMADPALRPGRIFASHYYAGYHRLDGEAGTEPFPKDVTTAAQYLERLRRLDPDAGAVPEWGRRFGQFMREKHRGDDRAKPNLSFALVLHGDEFLRVLQRETAARQRESLGKAREAHQTAFRDRWRDYLRETEKRVQASHPGLYAAFAAERARHRHLMSGGVMLVSAEVLARFDGETSRLAGFAEYFHNHAQCPVLDFWQWDERLNPQRFGTATPTGLEHSRAEMRS